MCVSANGDAKRAGKTKVSKLDCSLAINKKVLRLQVAMQDAMGVAERDALQQLPHVTLKRNTINTENIAFSIESRAFTKSGAIGFFASSMVSMYLLRSWSRNSKTRYSLLL